MPLFENVSYHLSQSLAEHTTFEISRMLNSNAATAVPIDLATHVISDTIEFEGCDTLRKGVVCVTPYWVERSMELGHLQDPKYFSADKDMFFSGVVATSADLPLGDKEVIASGILAQGGAWREGLTRDVTHLFVTNTRSEKYQTAMHFRDSAHITIVLPQWFDQCWSTQMRLPSEVFQFPDPPYFLKDHDIAAYKAQMLVKQDAAALISGADKQAIFGTLKGGDSSSPPAPPARNIWQGRCILLSPLLELDAQRRESVEARIRRAGGVVVIAQEENEGTIVDEADILITRFRTGTAYAKALAAGKTIGTLAWLFYVERAGVMSRPRDQLLHYPVRSKPIPGFSDHEITVTNYQGDAREYLKKLIELMGAKFTPTMSGRNTIVIAAYKNGNKTAKAEEWSVPVVTHKWLEDCFVEWRNLTPAQRKYLDYAPGVNYGTVLGDRGVGRVGLEEDPDLSQKIRKEPPRIEKQPKYQEPKEVEKPIGEGLNGTGASVREALEVDEVEDVLNIRGDHQEDPGKIRKDPSLSPIKVGPPRGGKTLKKTTAAEPSQAQPKQASVAPLDAMDADMAPLNIPQGAPKSSGSDAKLPQTDKTSEPGLEKIITPTKAGSLVKPMPQSRPTPSGAIQMDDDDSVVEFQPAAEPKPPQSRRQEGSGKIHVTNLKSPPSPQTISSKKHVVSVHGSDQESIAEVEHIRPKGKARQLDTDVRSDEDDFIPQVKPKSKSIIYRRQNRATTPINVESDGDDETPSGVDVTPSRTKTKPVVKKKPVKATSKVKATRAPSTSESESDNKDKTPPPKKAARSAGATPKSKPRAPQPSPNRVVSVDLPDPRSLLASIHRPVSPDSTDSDFDLILRQPKSPQRTSAHVSAYEASLSSPKRARPVFHRARDTTSSSSTPSPRRSPRRPPIGSSSATRKSATIPFMPSSSTQRSPSRRTAATAATQKLRDEVMPDVVDYENERKRGTKGGRRRRSSHRNVRGHDNEDEESDHESRDRKRRKIATFDDEEEQESSNDRGLSRSNAEDSDVPPSRFVTTTKIIKRPAADGDRTGPGGTRKKARKEKSVSEHASEDERAPNRSSTDPKKIRILTTKIVVTEQVEKAMTKLGVKFTQKPQECTHLVTNNLSRTEKFLCALPNVPFVVNMDWLTACADSRSVVAEDDYALQDPDMEHKHKFKLVDALRRAKELKKKKQKLLQGHFFYVTPGVPSDFNVLKNVLHALGAECRQASPTVRNVSETRHVISSMKDKSLWQPLVKHGVTVYSHELVLGAAFTQIVDWDGEDKILARGD